MHPFDAKKPPQLALLLGYAGLVPFVSGALGIWVFPWAGGLSCSMPCSITLP